MKNQQKQSFTGLIVMLLAASVLSLAACTKTKETKSTVDPAAYLAKSDFDGKTFSLVRGVEEADSNNVVGAIPGMSDDFGFVKVRITETEIQFIEVFNPYNKAATQSILASYKITSHFDVERETNDFNESTHKVVEKKERPWNQRTFMRVDWVNPTNEKSSLWKIHAETLADLVEQTKLENPVLLTDPKIENGHISWLTEFSLPGGVHWWGTDSNSRVVMRTHLMPVKQTDYQALNYRNSDFKRFGMFFTQQQFENPEKGLMDSDLEDHTFAQLHNVCEPGRKDAAGKPLSCSTNKIVWHLTKNFPEKFRQVSRDVVSEWNQTFKEALNRQDDVVTLDESFEVDIVDPRYNTIASYPSKSPGGLLGVAQETANPITGELIASRATIYEDGIRYELGVVDDVVTMILSDDEIRQAFLATDEETKERVQSLFKAKGALNKTAAAQRLSTVKSKVATDFASMATGLDVRSNISAIADRFKEPIARSIARKAALMNSQPGLFATVEGSRAHADVASYDETFGLIGAQQLTKKRIVLDKGRDVGGVEALHDVGSAMREERARMVNQAATGIHGAELVEDATLSYIKKVLREHPEANDFRSQVAAIKAEVERKTFYTTLLHEMGHTFGLRHNFQASADAKHYHPEFFRLSKVLELEKDLPDDQKTVTQGDLQPYMFSSIMDYGGDFYSQLGGLGPYDKAAIKYAYNRSIDKVNDPVVKENFQFCTDHQVNESILCRRFDKGRNVSEITFNLIETYQTNYVLSHNRRGRTNFDRRARSYPMAALTRYFVPVRQVMDEALFALINSQTVAAKENECGQDYWRTSVDAGEIVNVCNAVEAERAGVDPTNLESFEAGLFDQTGLRKDPTSYKPYGLADLLFANLLAKRFFTEVLGSPEPGTYIAIPSVVKGEPSTLEKLPDGGNLDESLAAIATEKGLEVSPELIVGMKTFVGEIKPGRYGKVLESKFDESDSQARQSTIGSFWDKYVAMIALGLKDIGVEKYGRHSMTGNAYTFPGTTGFTQKVIKSMIVQTDRLATVPFKTQRGTVSATVAPALNVDIRAIATITALTDFVSDQDKSIVGKLTVCSVDERGCQAPFQGQKTIEFTSASGQTKFRAAQTQEGDSIAFDMLTAAAKVDKERMEWVTKAQAASDIAADNIMKVTELTPARENLEKTLLALDIAKLTAIVPVLLAADGKTVSVWAIANVIATQGEQIPLFSTIKLAQQANGALGTAAEILGQAIAALDPKGQCPLPEILDAETEKSKSKLPAVIGLEALVKGRATKFSAVKSPLLQALGGGDAPLDPAQEAEDKNNGPKPDCADVNTKRAPLLAAAMDFQEFAKGLGGILSGGVNAKVAPLRATRSKAELQRVEDNITFIRQISKAMGLQ